MTKNKTFVILGSYRRIGDRKPGIQTQEQQKLPPDFYKTASGSPVLSPTFASEGRASPEDDVKGEWGALKLQ